MRGINYMLIMSRFQREISGSLGTFWKEKAEEEAKKTRKRFHDRS